MNVEESKFNLDDPLILVHERNAFYRKKYYYIVAVYLLSIIANIFMVGVIFFLLKNPTYPIYFLTDDVSRIIQDVPVQVPNMSTNDVSDWAVQAVESAYTYNFMNYRQQLQNAQKYFTHYGWRNYMRGLVASNNLTALAQRKMIVIANVIEQPKLEREGILSGAYAWKFNMKVLVTYLVPPYSDDPQSKFSNSLNVSIIVQRQSLLQSYKGLGVLQIIGTFA